MNNRFEALDAFRGLAAICVVIFHMRIVGSITEHDFFRASSVFVDLFFVLSGFVLTHGYAAKKIDFFGFMRLRFYRLYPLHFVMFMVFLLFEVGKLAAYKYGGFIFNNVPFDGRTALSEVLPNILLIQSWTPFSDHLSFNYPSWSISIEFYLYFLLFISIAFFKKLRTTIWMAITITALYLISSESQLFVRPVLSGLSCFFGGALVYLVYRKIAHVRIKKIQGSIIEAFTIIVLIGVVQSEIVHRSIVTTILFYLTILVFSFQSGVISNLLRLRPFQVLGKLSYSIYMIHAAILFCITSILMILQKYTGIEFAPMINQSRFLKLGSEGVNNAVLVSILVFVIFVSNLTYKYIELKWQRIGKSKTFPSSRK